MNWTPNRRNLLKTGAAAAALGFTGRTAWAQDIPTTPEAGDIKMGIEPWLGYGQWHIAAKKDLFKQAGLGTVEIINFNTDADINAALAAGPAAMRQHRHAYGDEFHRRRTAVEDRGAARRFEDRRRHDLRRIGHRHQGPQGQAGRL